MDDAEPPVAERIAHLEGAIEAEDKAFDRGLENVKHTQALLIGVCAIMIGAGVAFLVYVLNRMDTLSLMISHH